VCQPRLHFLLRFFGGFWGFVCGLEELFIFFVVCNPPQPENFGWGLTVGVSKKLHPPARKKSPLGKKNLFFFVVGPGKELLFLPPPWESPG